MELEELKVLGDINNNKPINKSFFALEEDIKLILTLENYILGFDIKRHFITDFASIPKIFRWFCKPEEDLVKKASVVHDICFNLKYKNLEESAELMYCMMEYHIRNLKTNRFNKFLLKVKAKIIKKAVETFIANKQFKETDENDIYNKNYCSIRRY
jgi:hypothetical protein